MTVFWDITPCGLVEADFVVELKSVFSQFHFLRWPQQIFHIF